MGIIENVTEKHHYEENLINDARYDALTNLLNRRGFKSLFKQKIKSNVKQALLIDDIDHFKEINDNYGHIKGDEVLKDFAEAISHNLGVNDLACRLGGDEFILFLDDTSEKKIEESYQKVLNIIKKKYDYFSLSAGVTFVSGESDTFEKLYEEADKALYEVKNNGRKKIEFYKYQET